MEIESAKNLNEIPTTKKSARCVLSHLMVFRVLRAGKGQI